MPIVTRAEAAPSGPAFARPGRVFMAGHRLNRTDEKGAKNL